MLRNSDPDEGDAVRFRAAEHRVCTGERDYLFGVRSLSVIPFERDDGEILAAANRPVTRYGLISRLAGKVESVEERVARLVEQGFLQPESGAPPTAEQPPPSPSVTFMLVVSQRCNLRCTYCYVYEGQFDFDHQPSAQMSPDSARIWAESLIEAFPGLEVYCFHFYGGEPTMNMKAVRLAVEAAEEAARRAGARAEFMITTNGTLITDEVARFLNEHRFTVYLSIDGDEPTHDANRPYRSGRRSYAKVVGAIEKLRGQPDVRLVGSSVISAQLSLGDALASLRGHGIAEAKAERVHLDPEDGLCLRGENRELYIEEVRGLAKQYIDALETGETPIDSRLNSRILQLFSKTRRERFCTASEGTFGVTATGEIYPCALMIGREEFHLGSVREGISGPGRERFARRFGMRHQDSCRVCWARFLCGGGCPAMVDRFGHDDCDVLRAECESAIEVYGHFGEGDPLSLLGLIDPRFVRWVCEGESQTAEPGSDDPL